MLLALLICLFVTDAKHHNLNHQVMFKRDDEVVLLNRENFDAALMRFDVLLVSFYAPWCPHCQRLEPEFAQAAQMLKEEKSKITLGKVDCTKESYLCQEFEVRGYPTLRIFYHDRIYHYYGTRDAKGIVQFMKTHLQQEENNH